MTILEYRRYKKTIYHIPFIIFVFVNLGYPLASLAIGREFSPENYRHLMSVNFIAILVMITLENRRFSERYIRFDLKLDDEMLTLRDTNHDPIIIGRANIRAVDLENGWLTKRLTIQLKDGSRITSTIPRLPKASQEKLISIINTLAP